MLAENVLGVVVLILAVAGLIGVVAEMLIRDPSALWEVVTDVRKMAEPKPQARRMTVANSSHEDIRKAA